MTQTTKNISHATFHLVLFLGVILCVALLKQLVVVPESTPITVTPESKSYSTTEVADESQTKKSNTSHANATPQKQHASLSPAQEKIKESVKTEYIYRMFASPNDPAYESTNWSLAKVNAESAWDIATGDGSTVVAVIDSGFALTHDDLSDRWYQNAGEKGLTQSGDPCWTGSAQNKSTNSCDDDANGYVDDWRGWNFVIGDNNPQTGRQNSTGNGIRHGTQVSGLVGASGNNSAGIATINWDTIIMPLQALDDDGIGYTSDVTAAIYYAADNGADVINLSLGSNSNDPAVRTAVNYAVNNNVVVVAAAGNCGDGTGDECSGVPMGAIGYPAAYPDVIAVGATTQSDTRAGFSSYGPALDVTAPGSAVPISTSWSADNQTSLYTTNLYGTSFSSPLVASLVALIKSIRPSTSVADVTALIDATASKPSGMSGLYYTQAFGHGIIDAQSALTIATALNSTSDTPVLLQAGNHKNEHTTGKTFVQSSGCATATGNPCTVQFYQPSTGYTRYLPYQIAGNDGAGWSWKPGFIDVDSWEIRARIGENITNTPYILMKKG